jgi:hypothetical protein
MVRWCITRLWDADAPLSFCTIGSGSWRYWVNAMQVASTSFRAYAHRHVWFWRYFTRSICAIPSINNPTSSTAFCRKWVSAKWRWWGMASAPLLRFTFIKQFSPSSVDRMMAINCPLEYDSINTRLRTASMRRTGRVVGIRSPEAVSALSDAAKGRPASCFCFDDQFAGKSSTSMAVRDLGVPCLFVYGSEDPAISMPTPRSGSDALPLHMHQVNTRRRKPLPDGG